MIRNLYLSTLLLAISVVFLSACEKEKVSPTQAELTANELKSIVEKNGLKRIYPIENGQVFPNQFSAERGTQWSFANGFFYVDYGRLEGYNLTYLVKHTVSNVGLSDGTRDRALILYMEQ